MFCLMRLSDISVVSRRLRFADTASGHDGLRVDVELVDHRRLYVFGKVLQNPIDPIANVLRSGIGGTFEAQSDEDLRHTFGRNRAHLVDSFDRVDRFFDPLRYLSFDFFWRRARKSCRHGDGRELDLWKKIDAQLHVSVAANYDQRDSEHGREYRPLDTYLRKLLHNSSYVSRLYGRPSVAAPFWPSTFHCERGAATEGRPYKLSRCHRGAVVKLFCVAGNHPFTPLNAFEYLDQ